MELDNITLMMEAAHASEMTFYFETTWCYISEG
jgi:hypothetical protein